MLRTLTMMLVVLLLGAAPASAAWLEPGTLSPGSAPVLAVAPGGTAWVAFERSDGANTRVAVAQRTPGGGFGPARDLSAAGRDAFSPSLAVDRAGNVTLAWMQGAGFVVQARFRPAGGDWGEATPPLSLGAILTGPSVAVGEGGAAVIAWTRGNVVEAVTRRSAAAPFGPAQAISPGTGTGICLAPRVAMNRAGDATALWTRRTSTTGDFHVESATKAVGADAWGAPVARSSVTGNSDCNTDVAAADDGHFVTAWDFAETGQPSAVFLSGVRASAPAVRSIRPVIALPDSAAWIAGGQVVSSAGGVLKPLSGATDLSGLAIGGNGTETQIAFVGSSNGTDALFASRRVAGGGFADVVPVASTVVGESLATPDVALDDQGNAFATWVRRSGATSSVEVAGFDAVPPVFGSVEVPAAGVAGTPVAMSATAADRMSAPAVQFDFGDGSSGSGQHVYGAAGSYTVAITATDAAGNVARASRGVGGAPAPAGGGAGGGGGGG